MQYSSVLAFVPGLFIPPPATATPAFNQWASYTDLPARSCWFFFFNKLHPLVVDDFKEADVLDLASSLHFQHYRWGNTRFGIEE